MSAAVRAFHPRVPGPQPPGHNDAPDVVPEPPLPIVLLPRVGSAALRQGRMQGRSHSPESAAVHHAVSASYLRANQLLSWASAENLEPTQCDVPTSRQWVRLSS